jgi:tetratricopeptide (TPR) repeat protein
MRLIAACCLLAFAASPLAAAEFKGEDDAKYQACLKLAARQPEVGFENALQWRERGGGAPARHCAAMALIQLRHYADAADRLEQLAADLRKTNPPLVPEVLSQAGNAWLLAGFAERADAVLTSALALRPADADLYIDRARVRAARESFREALGDLDAALMIEPDRAEALAFRASAHRALGEHQAALADAERALVLDPNQIEALLERGHLRRIAGDIRGARADWVKVLQLAAGTPAGDAAALNIQKMELKAD